MYSRVEDKQVDRLNPGNKLNTDVVLKWGGFQNVRNYISVDVCATSYVKFCVLRCEIERTFEDSVCNEKKRRKSIF